MDAELARALTDMKLANDEADDSEDSPDPIYALDLTGYVDIMGGYVGGGTHGNVYRGVWCRKPGLLASASQSSKTPPIIAIKVFKNMHHDDRWRRKEVFNELRSELALWEDLDHKNIIPLFGVACLDSHSNNPSIVTLWMENGNLATYLERTANADRLAIYEEIILGLQYLHNHNPSIPHGNLKPYNILVDLEGHVRLNDFGLMRKQREQQSGRRASSISTDGTFRYTAPELLSGVQANATTASDIYSLSMIGYFLFTGFAPFSELRRDDHVLAAVSRLNRRPNRPQNLDLAYGTELWNVWQRCWEGEPRMRLNIDEVGLTLSDLMEASQPSWVGVMNGHTLGVCSVTFSPDGKRIASGSQDMTVRVWDAKTGEAVGTAISGHGNLVNSVAFSRDGKRIASGSADNTIRVWNAETGQGIGAAMTGHTHYVSSVAFSHDGKRIASGSCDNTVRVWNAETGRTIGSAFTGHSNYVNSVAFSPDGKWIVSGSSDRTVRVWNAETGQVIGSAITGHTNGVVSVAFSSDGKRIVSGAWDNTVRVWNAQTGQAIGSAITEHTHYINSVAFSPDGKRIVSGAYDNTIRFWNSETGQMIGSAITGHTGYVYSVAFSPDGRRIVSGSADSSVRVWHAPRL